MEYNRRSYPDSLILPLVNYDDSLYGLYSTATHSFRNAKPLCKINIYVSPLIENFSQIKRGTVVEQQDNY